MDVGLSRDGEAIVFHDEDLRRMWGLPSRLRDLDLAELKTLRFPDGSAVPTLEEAIAALGETPMLIELKAYSDPEEIAWKALRLLSGAQGRFALMSFSTDTVQTLLASAPQIPIGLLVDASTDQDLGGLLDWMMTRGCAFAGPNLALLARREFADCPLPCVVWTVRRREDLPDRPGYAPIFEGLEPEEVRQPHDS